MRLPRLPTLSILDRDMRPLTSFQLWWQRVVEQIESQFATLTQAIADILAAQAAADAAQTTADGNTAAIADHETRIDALEAAGSALSGVATVTVPNNFLEWEETISATGVVGTDNVGLFLSPHTDADENDPEFLVVSSMAATAGTDQITVSLAFGQPVAGPVKLIWKVV